jgi:hypothetical protein
VAVEIQDLQQECEVNTLEELERVIARRYGNDVNAFWINRGRNLLPLLLILINKAYAYMFYFPNEDGHPGFHSVGHLPELDPDQDTTFFMNRIDEPEDFPNCRGQRVFCLHRVAAVRGMVRTLKRTDCGLLRPGHWWRSHAEQPGIG